MPLPVTDVERELRHTRRVRYEGLLSTGENIRRGLEARIDGRDGDANPVRPRR